MQLSLISCLEPTVLWASNRSGYFTLCHVHTVQPAHILQFRHWLSTQQRQNFPETLYWVANASEAATTSAVPPILYCPGGLANRRRVSAPSHGKYCIRRPCVAFCISPESHCNIYRVCWEFWFLSFCISCEAQCSIFVAGSELCDAVYLLLVYG